MRMRSKEKYNMSEIMRTPTDWDTVFIEMAKVIASRSKDPSTNVGAVLVDKNNVILSTGFNGPPRQLYDNMIPWETRPDKYDYIIHAEENALLFALGSHGSMPLIGSKMYCTHIPCPSCVLRMIRADVAEIVYPKESPDYPLRKLLDSCKAETLIDKQKFPKLNVRTIDTDWENFGWEKDK